MEKLNLIVSNTPHIRSNDTVNGIMRDVIIALVPAAFAGIWFFGYRAFLMMAISVISCLVFETLCNKLSKKQNTIWDLSAVVTGLLLAMNMPAAAPLWMPIVGSFVAIVIAKQVFGGIGQNFINPALAGRAFLLASYPVGMTAWTEPAGITSNALDAVATATPLAILKSGEGIETLSLFDAFIGNIGGCIGETSALALLIGFAYLLYRKVISWRIPVVYVGTVFVLTFLLGYLPGATARDAFYEIFAGGLLLGAIFMATDYTTSPMTAKGQVIMAVACGVLTTLIRIFGGYPEGVSYSILLMNLCVPLIDRYTRPKLFGEVKK